MIISNRFSRQNSLYLVILFFIILVGIFLRYPGLARDSLWLDEAWRLQSYKASLSSNDLKVFTSQLIGFDGLMRLFIFIFGDKEWSLRAISFYSSILSVPLVYYFGIKVSNKQLPSIIVAFLLAINPWYVAYSTEMASYAFGSFFYLLFLISLIKLYEINNAYSLLLAIIVGVVLSVMHLYFFVLVVISIFVYLVICWNNENNKNKIFLLFFIILIANIFEVLSYFNYAETDEVSLRYNINWTVGFPLKVLNALTSGPIPNRFVSTISMLPTWYKFIYFSILLLTCSLFIRSFAYYLKRLKKIEILFVYPILLYILFIYIQGHIVNGAFLRYLIPIVPILLHIVVHSIMNFSDNNIRIYKYIFPFFVFFILNYSLALFLEIPGEKYKPKYREFFSSFSDECMRDNVYFLNPNIEEVTIANYYLSETECNVVAQPSFKGYFEDKNLNLMDDKASLKEQQDDWMAKEIIMLLDQDVGVYLIARRKHIRTEEIAKMTKTKFDKITNKYIPDLLILKFKK